MSHKTQSAACLLSWLGAAVISPPRLVRTSRLKKRKSTAHSGFLPVRIPTLHCDFLPIDVDAVHTEVPLLLRPDVMTTPGLIIYLQ